MKKFVKCKKSNEGFFTENEMYEVSYHTNLSNEKEIIIRTNFKTLLVIGLVGKREDYFKNHFYTEQELRKIKIKNILSGGEE